MDNVFYDKEGSTQKYRRNLPHWFQAGKMNFVTFRLIDSVPAERVQELKRQREQWQKGHSKPYAPAEWAEYNKLFNHRMEQWLDDCYGECILGEKECGQIASQAIEHFNNQRYLLDHWVIMPNHVHVLIVPLEEYKLRDILHSWKSFTANEINKKTGSKGALWQHESFDHIVRNEKQLERFRQYIIENAVKANGRAIWSKHSTTTPFRPFGGPTTPLSVSKIRFLWSKVINWRCSNRLC